MEYIICRLLSMRNFYIRRSIKYDQLIKKIEQFVAEKPGSQLTATILEMATLGIKSYEAGFRLVDDTLLNINNYLEENNNMNVEREVARSIFTSLAGSLSDLERYEESKPSPDKNKLDFYELVAKALFSKHAKFRHSTDSDVNDIFKNIALILKQMRTNPDNVNCEKVIQENRDILMNLVNSTELKNVA